MTRISVLLTTFNGGTFIDRQLDSILRQHHLPSQLLIGDDGSSDDTIERIGVRLRNAPFDWDITVNTRRLGVVKNFEALIGRATGEVSVLSDQDDEWVPERLERMHNIFDVNSDVSAVFSNGDLMNDASESIPGFLWDAAGFTAARQSQWQQDPLAVLLQRNVVTGAAFAFRTSLRSFLVPLSSNDWHDYWIALLLAATQKRIIASNERLIRYRLHEANQAGLPRTGLRRYSRAKVSPYESRERQRRLLEELSERTSSLGLAPPLAVTAAREHLTQRQTLPTSLPARAYTVLSECRTGRYRSFSQGWLSVLSDLLRAGPKSQDNTSGWKL